MRSTRRSIWSPGRAVSSTILLLLLTLLGTTIIARAADDADEGDEYDVTARVVRISLISGQVSLKRNGNQDWERARLNTRSQFTRMCQNALTSSRSYDLCTVSSVKRIGFGISTGIGQILTRELLRIGGQVP